MTPRDRNKRIRLILDKASEDGIYNRWEAAVNKRQYWSNNIHWTLVCKKEERPHWITEINAPCYAAFSSDQRTFPVTCKPEHLIGCFFNINPGFNDPVPKETEKAIEGCKTGKLTRVIYNKQYQFIRDMLSEQSPYYKSVVALNPPVSLTYKEKKVTINTTEYVMNHGFVVYNPEQTCIAPLLVFLCQLRFIAEYPCCVRNYFHLRLKGADINDALLLCHTNSDISAMKEVPYSLCPIGHSAIDLTKVPLKDYKDFFINGIRSAKDEPMTTRTATRHMWTHMVCPSGGLNNGTGQKKIIEDMSSFLNKCSVEQRLKFGSFNIKKAMKPTTSFYSAFNPEGQQIAAMKQKLKDVDALKHLDEKKELEFQFDDAALFMIEYAKEIKREKQAA